jgi:hypothetical protein
MEPEILGAIARVVSEEGAANGTASLVGKNLVLTALHVVADRTAEDPAFFPAPIRIRFRGGFETTATKVAFDRLEDWVLLACTSPTPESIAPLPLGTINRDGDEWKSYGFPITTEYSPDSDAAGRQTNAKADGLVIRGTVRARHGKLVVEGHDVPAYQLHCDEVASGQGLRASGLSGAPVIVNGSLVGMLRWSPLEDYRAEGGTLYACPATSIVAKCRHQFPAPLKNVSRRSNRTAATVAAAAVVTLLAGWYVTRGTTPDPPRDSTQFVIDASKRMYDTFNEKTKIAWAIEALSGKAFLATENVALRSFGADCSNLYATGDRLVMPFGVGRGKDVVGAAKRLERPGEVGGQAALLDAIARAMADVKRFPNKRRVIVITGGLDECPKSKDKEVFADQIARLKNDREGELDLDLHFVAVGVTADEERFFKTLPERTGATVSVAHDGGELKAALAGDPAAPIFRWPPTNRPPAAEPIPEPPPRPNDAPVGKAVSVGGAPGTKPPPAAASAPTRHQVIVVDASKNMETLFAGSASKLDAALVALQGERLLLTDDATGLWKFGGDCSRGDGGAQQVLPVERDLITRLRKRGKQLGPPQGEPTLFFGVIAAVNELKRFSGSRKIIVLTGGDACPSDLKGLVERMTDAGFKKDDLYFRFVGLGVSPEGKTNVEQLAAATNGEAFFVRNTEELSKVLQWLLKAEPVLLEVDEMWKVVGGPVKGFNQLNAAFNDRKFDDAQKLVAEVQDAHERAGNRFGALAQKEPSAMFRDFYKLAASNRTLDGEALDLARDIIKYGKQFEASSGSPSEDLVNKLGQTTKDWAKNFDDYNANFAKMKVLTEQMRKELTGQ